MIQITGGKLRDIIQFRRFWSMSDISEISEIIALLFHLCGLYHYYCYSGVGHCALLGAGQGVLLPFISLLLALRSHNSVPNVVSLYRGNIRYYDCII